MNIKIGGYEVKVIEKENLIGNYEHFGEYSEICDEIYLDSSLNKQKKIETLIHEILEAINTLYKLNLNHDKQLCVLAVVLHQILIDNPNLVLNVYNR